MDYTLNSSAVSNLSQISNNSPNNLKSKLMSIIKKSNKVFVGEYLERRLVQHHPYTNYKDIVVIDNGEEVIKSLEELHRYIHTEFKGEKSLGITRTLVDDEVQDYKLWVDLTEQVPLGKHWFQIKSIKMIESTVQLQLKYLRPFESTSRKSIIPDNYAPFDINEILTFHNFTETLKFSVIVFMSLITFLAHFLWYLSDYSLKMTRELSNLITAMTPVIFGLYDFLSRCIGGLFWFIYLLFRGSPSPTNATPYGRMAIMPNTHTPPPLRNVYRYQQKNNNYS